MGSKMIYKKYYREYCAKNTWTISNNNDNEKHFAKFNLPRRPVGKG